MKIITFFKEKISIQFDTNFYDNDHNIYVEKIIDSEPELDERHCYVEIIELNGSFLIKRGNRYLNFDGKKFILSKQGLHFYFAVNSNYKIAHLLTVFSE